jgi:hypothetical protein
VPGSTSQRQSRGGSTLVPSVDAWKTFCIRIRDPDSCDCDSACMTRPGFEHESNLGLRNRDGVIRFDRGPENCARIRRNPRRHIHGQYGQTTVMRCITGVYEFGERTRNFSFETDPEKRIYDDARFGEDRRPIDLSIVEIDDPTRSVYSR